MQYLVQIKFLYNSNKITDGGAEKLNQLKSEIAEFDSQTVGVRFILILVSQSLVEQIGRERGEEVAGYLRHLGLKNKIVISKRSANSSQNNLSSPTKKQSAINS